MEKDKFDEAKENLLEVSLNPVEASFCEEVDHDDSVV